MKMADTEPVELELTGDGFTFIAPITGAISGNFGLYLDASTASALSAGMSARWVGEYEDELQKTLVRVVKAMADASKILLAKLDMKYVISEIS
jgi:hypothetical protein